MTGLLNEVRNKLESSRRKGGKDIEEKKMEFWIEVIALPMKKTSGSLTKRSLLKL